MNSTKPLPPPTVGKGVQTAAQAATRAYSLFGLPSWVPVRFLHPRHRNRIQAHLLALSASDRYLRFGHTAGDEQILQYAAGIDFTRDEVFGIFNRRLRLIAMAHLAYDRPPQRTRLPSMAEFGVSVAPDARGRGYGTRLFDHAVTHARNRGIETLLIHALTENSAMLKIARRSGATIERDGGDSVAWLKLPPDTFGSRFGQTLHTQAAEANFWLKRQAVRLRSAMALLQEVRAQVAATGKAAQV